MLFMPFKYWLWFDYNSNGWINLGILKSSFVGTEDSKGLVMICDNNGWFYNNGLFDITVDLK